MIFQNEQELHKLFRLSALIFKMEVFFMFLLLLKSIWINHTFAFNKITQFIF